ncbi:MAG: nucleotide exchange factor GrpE [Jatrophihabitantaceae bacterium]
MSSAHDETDNEGGAGRSEQERPVPGFTFADKRKIHPDGTPVSRPETERGAGTEPVIDANELLAAERLSDLQRLQAEYANYRKRVERDRAIAREQTIAAVVESLLPVLDDIQLARQHGDLESGPFASVADKLESTLAKYGVQRFGEPGAAFDPAVHDALMHVEEELAEGTETTTVVGVLQPGYRIGDRVIRPARVSVADPS